MYFQKISVVTPNFNGAMFLEETILSVLDQGYPNLEYIVIDGGSSDRSLEIIKKYESRINYWVSEKDNGLYDALNKGFIRSSGEIMMWINSDDRLLANSLFHISNIFSQLPEINWLTGRTTFLNETGIETGSFNSRNLSKYNFFIGDYEWIQQESTAWKRKLWDDAGAYISLKYKLAGDFELWHRFMNYSTLFVADLKFGAFRIRKGQLSSDFRRYSDEVFEIISEAKDSRYFFKSNAILLLKKTSNLFHKLRLLKISLLFRNIEGKLHGHNFSNIKFNGKDYVVTKNNF